MDVRTLEVHDLSSDDGAAAALAALRDGHAVVPVDQDALAADVAERVELARAAMEAARHTIGT